MTTHVAICAWVDIIDECCGPVEWSRVVLPQDLQVGCCGMSDASVGDVAAHGDRQQTTLPVVLELLLLTCHLDNLLI